MIFYNVTKTLFFIILLNVTNAQSVTARIYTATYKLHSPLSTYERCEEISSLGMKVVEAAMDQAMDDCRAEMNVDCVEVGAKVWAEVSTEFPGYRSCSAKAIVRGYSR